MVLEMWGLKGFTVLQNYPRYRRMSRKKMRNERNLYQYRRIFQMHLQWWLLWRRIQLHRYPSVLFRFLDRDLMKSHIPQIKRLWKRSKAFDYYNYFPKNLDKPRYLVLPITQLNNTEVLRLALRKNYITLSQSFFTHQQNIRSWNLCELELKKQ